MKKSLIIAMIAAILLLSASAALAGNPGVGFSATQCEYVTYGGFDSVDQAFHRIGLIFSDPSYTGLYFVAAMFSILIATYGFFLNYLTGGRAGGFAYAVPIFMGCLLYMVFIVPKGTVTVYDPVYNKFASEPNIPIGIVMSAGALNLIEQDAVQIIDTSGLPTSYQNSAGGKGIEVLLHLYQGGLVSGDHLFDKNLSQYIESCLYPALSGNGGGISLNMIMQGTQDFYGDVLSQPAVANPAFSSPWMTDTGPQDPTPSCDVAYTQIAAWIGVQANIDNMVNTTCSESGFDITDGNQLTQCRDLIAGWITQMTGGNVSLSYSNVMLQVYTAMRLADAASQNGTLSTQSFYQGLNSITQETSLNEWIPVMRSVITAIAIGILPFLLIFLPSSLGFKAVGAAAGMFVWITVWGITDCVVHQYLVDYAVNLFKQLSNMQMGYDMIMFLPTPATKVLGLFGNARMFAMGLSTVITGLLVKFGGTAMAMATGQMTGSVQAAAGDAAQKTLDPAGKVRQEMAQSEAIAGGMFTNKHSVSARAMAGLGQKEYGHGGFAQGQAMGSVGNQLGMDQMIQGNEGNIMDTQAGGGAKKPVGFNTLQQTANTEIQQRVGGAAGVQGAANASNESVSSMAQRNTMIGLTQQTATSQHLTTDTAKQMGEVAALTGASRAQATEDMYNGMMERGEATSMNDAALKHANVQMATDQSIMQAFHGNANAYKDFLTNNRELDMGQQKGTIRAAQAAGVNLSDYAETNKFMQEMKNVGAIDAFASGRISSDDLRNIGKTGLLSEAGRTDAAQKLAHTFGGDVRGYQSQLGTWQGMEQYTKFDALQKFADAKHIDLQSLMQAGAQSTSVTVGSAALAKQLGLPGTGRYDLSFDNKGQFVFSNEKAGTEFQVGTFGNTGSSVIDHHENETRVSSGTSYGPNVMGMALDGNRELFAGAAKSGFSEGERANFAANWSKAMSSYMSEHGVTTDSARAEAYMEGRVKGGFSLLGIGGSAEAGAKGSVDATTQHNQQSDLLTAAGTAIFDRTLHDAQSQHLSTEQTQALLARRFQEASQNVKHGVDNKTSFNFGAAAPAMTIGHAYNKLKDAVAPYPMASPGEQNRRENQAKADFRNMSSGR